MGANIVVNAVRDACMLVDSPPCGFEKAFLLASTHDLFSDVFRPGEAHRVQCTMVGPDGMIFDRADQVLGRLETIQDSGEASLIFLATMPLATVTGIDYASIVDRARSRGSRVILVPETTSGRNWLDGYDEVLEQIALNLDFPRVRRKKRDVAVVGYLFDRHEGDHLGNVAELERLFQELSLNLVSVWLDGSDTQRLIEAGRAGTIVSLPYGRRAAAAIAGKTGARLLELDLPAGLGGSRRWLQAIGDALGVARKARSLIDAELETVIPVLDRVASDHLQDRRFSYFGDPFLGEAVMDALDEVGCLAEQAVIFAAPGSVKRLTRSRFVDRPDTLFRPGVGDVIDLDYDGLDFVLGNSWANYIVKARCVRKHFVEIGFPSYGHHCLSSAPFLFFRGFVNLVNRIVNRD